MPERQRANVILMVNIAEDTPPEDIEAYIRAKMDEINSLYENVLALYYKRDVPPEG